MGFRLLFLAGMGILAACGYQVLDPGLGGGRTLWIPTSTNDSRWRGVEADLTHELRDSLRTQLDIRLDHENPDLILRTKLLKIQRGSAISGRGGTVLAGRATLQIEWDLENARGESLAGGTTSRALEFSPQDGETAYFAFDDLIRDMAEQIALETGVALRPVIATP